MTTYLVTGGAGFIGSNIVRELVRRGSRPRVLDNFATGRRENLAGLAGAIELIEGDVTCPDAARRATQGVDFVLHQAALPSVPRSVADPLASHHANATGTLVLLAAAAENRVKRVVYAGSSSAYGDAPTLPKHEAMPPRPLSPYAAGKLAGEHYCKAFTACFGLETVALRYFNVFGPRQNPASQYAAVIPRFIACLLDGEQPVIYGDGEQSRDFTYVSNVVEANLLACEAEGASGQVFNIACGQRASLNTLLATLADILRTDANPRFEPARPGDVKHSQADISRAHEVLGYRPRVSLKEGLRGAVSWCLAQRQAPDRPRTATGPSAAAIAEPARAPRAPTSCS